MKNLIQPILQRWQSLQPREKKALLGGAVGLLVVVYLAVLLPAQRQLATLRVMVPKEQTQLALMRVQARQASQLRARARPSLGSGALLSRLEQSAAARGLRKRITRMEPEGSHGARITLDNVDFNALAGWLADLRNQGGLRVEKATFEAQAEAGMVNARLVLRGPGA